MIDVLDYELKYKNDEMVLKLLRVVDDLQVENVNLQDEVDNHECDETYEEEYSNLKHNVEHILESLQDDDINNDDMIELVKDIIVDM